MVSAILPSTDLIEETAVGMPKDIGIIDTMISFPATDFSQYDFIRAQLQDAESRDSFDFPVEYMFKNVPKELYGTDSPIDVTLHEMDRFGVERAARLMMPISESGADRVTSISSAAKRSWEPFPTKTSCRV